MQYRIRMIWQQADALKLPFADNVSDVVVCKFGAMFFPDRMAGDSEILRVLKS
ncbi:MAG: methyltransferase domain-containing protein [Dehalococcoidia bacterium]|nr:methyltransferase domain-containing protein [Dehalococcoidia bacterium]